MRINPLGDGGLRSNKVEEKRRTSKRGKRTSRGERVGFFEVLSETEAELLEERIKEIVDGIIEAGNELARSPTRENLERYKERIKEFLKLIEKRLYRVSGKMDLESRKPKLHVLAEEVNEKLEELARAVFSSERSTLDIAAKVGEINGLILDIYE